MVLLIVVPTITFGCVQDKLISKGDYDNLEIVMQLEKSVFRQGENINIYLILNNNKDNMIYLDEKGFGVEIYSLDGMLITSIEHESVAPRGANIDTKGAFRDYFNWDQKYRSHNRVNRGLDPGKYYLVGYLRSEINYKDIDGKHTIVSNIIRTGPLEITIE